MHLAISQYSVLRVKFYFANQDTIGIFDDPWQLESESQFVGTNHAFLEQIVASSGITLTEVTLHTLGTIGAAAYILSQSSKVKQCIVKLKQAQDIEAKLNLLGVSINSLNSKLTGVAALSWVVAQQTKPQKDTIGAKSSIEPVWIRI